MLHIVADTELGLPESLIRQFNITLVPLYVMFGQESLREHFDLSIEAFYKRLLTDPHHPSTSQPSVRDFLDIYRGLYDQDPDATILSIHLSGKLSGLINAAKQAAAMLEEERIHILDTLQVSIGSGLQVLEAARMAAAGISVEAIIERQRAIAVSINVYAMVDTLEYLVKGGRLGKAAGMVGALLDLKPVLALRDGVVLPHSRARTRHKAIEMLRHLILHDAAPDDRIHLAVGHARCESEAKRFGEELCEVLNPAEFLLTEIGPALGVHMGPGALGLAWWKPSAVGASS
ncbi:MAG: DegV family protein [Anaerolineae bacterium]|nr:DegV family protein [Anaerolineae bacterium]